MVLLTVKEKVSKKILLAEKELDDKNDFPLPFMLPSTQMTLRSQEGESWSCFDGRNGNYLQAMLSIRTFLMVTSFPCQLQVKNLRDQ